MKVNPLIKLGNIPVQTGTIAACFDHLSAPNEKIRALEKDGQLIRLSEERPELNVTIVTWAPEVYRYGRDEVRIELMNRLKAAGFKLLTVEDNCERFAVIDKRSCGMAA